MSRLRSPRRAPTALLCVALLAACGNDSAADGTSIPPGTYRMHVDADDPRPGCVNGEIDIELLVGEGSMTRYRIIGGRRGSGQEFTFSVFRDQIAVRGQARALVGTWSVNGTSLSVTALDSDRCEDLSDWTAAPYELVDSQGAP